MFNLKRMDLRERERFFASISRIRMMFPQRGAEYDAELLREHPEFVMQCELLTKFESIANRFERWGADDEFMLLKSQVEKRIGIYMDRFGVSRGEFSEWCRDYNIRLTYGTR